MACVCADADLVEVSLQGLTRRSVSISLRRPHPPWRGRVSGSSGGIFACPATRTQLFEGSRRCLPPLAVLTGCSTCERNSRPDDGDNFSCSDDGSFISHVAMLRTT